MLLMESETLNVRPECVLTKTSLGPNEYGRKR